MADGVIKCKRVPFEVAVGCLQWDVVGVGSKVGRHYCFGLQSTGLVVDLVVVVCLVGVFAFEFINQNFQALDAILDTLVLPHGSLILHLGDFEPPIRNELGLTIGIELVLRSRKILTIVGQFPTVNIDLGIQLLKSLLELLILFRLVCSLFGIVIAFGLELLDFTFGLVYGVFVRGDAFLRGVQGGLQVGQLGLEEGDGLGFRVVFYLLNALPVGDVSLHSTELPLQLVEAGLRVLQFYLLFYAA
jgi:hypothetical protein